MPEIVESAPEWLPFDEFVEQIVGRSQLKPQSLSENIAIWENEAYRVELALETDGLHVLYTVEGKPLWQFITGTIAVAVEIIGSELSTFLNGPQPPRKSPKRLVADEQRIEALQKQMLDVQQQVHQLMDHRRWHLAYTEIVKRNPSLAAQNNPALSHLGTIYIHYAVLGVRRQAKYDKDSLSLIAVMRGVKEAARSITRHWHHRLWIGETKSPYRSVAVGGIFVDRMADEVFDRFAGFDAQKADPTIVQKDIEDFERSTRAIVDYADRMAAHRDRRGFAWDSYTPEELDLDAAILSIEAYTYQYSRLLFALAAKNMTPIAVADSLKIFRDAWIQTDEELNSIGRALNFMKLSD